nr:inaD-like protein isoform X2 [Cherax quadricarinatus]
MRERCLPDHCSVTPHGVGETSCKEKIQKKYGDLKGEVILVDLQKGVNGLGISLAGNKDRTLMSAFVCGLNPSGNAYKDGRIKVGDEVLEVSVMGKGEKDECHGGERG